MASRDLPAGGHLVIGRHTECDAILEGDPFASLRHLLVRVTSLDDGAPLLSIIDLRTDPGFTLSDGTRQRSIQATGPVTVRVGIHTIVALPKGELPDELPTPICERASEIPPVNALRPREEKSISRITMNPGVRHVTEPGEGSERPSDECAELELESARGRARVWLNARDLKNGVLVGRADRCVDEGLRRTLDLDVSRVHVLIMQERDRTLLFDVASTQGTYLDKRRIRNAVLGDGASVTLAKRNAVELRWRAIG